MILPNKLILDNSGITKSVSQTLRIMGKGNVVYLLISNHLHKSFVRCMRGMVNQNVNTFFLNTERHNEN